MVKFLLAAQQPPHAVSALAAADALVTDEDRALELATRPQRGVPLTPAERQVRRRLQYKLHQRRHRAKQRSTTRQLQEDIARLQHEIVALDRRRQELLARPLSATDVFGARGSSAGAPVRLVMEYMRLYEHGYSARRGPEQEQFSWAVMPYVVGPDYEGLDFLLDQWKLYETFFPRLHLSCEAVEVETLGDATVVVVDMVMAVRGRRAGFAAIYPGLRDDETVLRTIVSNGLCLSGKMRFTFGPDGLCSWFGTDFDFVATLQRALGSLDLVTKCFERANISFATGQIMIDYPVSEARGGCSRADAPAVITDDPAWMETGAWTEL